MPRINLPHWLVLSLALLVSCAASKSTLEVQPAVVSPTPTAAPVITGAVQPTMAPVAASGSAEPITPLATLPPFPATRHLSTESEIGHSPCVIAVKFAGFGVASQDVDLLFPSWAPVDPNLDPAVLEGTVVDTCDDGAGSRISWEDFPSNHYTHDFNFNVDPDKTPDNRYTNMLGTQVDASGTSSVQDTIEVEWETGLGADNSGNPLTPLCTKGDSGGFYSAGHTRGTEFWNWPNSGDHVHIEGMWIWDRAHPPAHTEIHPPRLIAIQRHLPELVTPVDHQMLATRVDVFASGDDNAFHNNRKDAASFVAPVRMSSRDYTFLAHNTLPRPSANAVLRAFVVAHNGDTFPANTAIQMNAGGDPSAVQITIPWKSVQAPDDAIFARTIYLYWDEGLGVPSSYRPGYLRVTLNNVLVNNSMDLGRGQYRLFAAVGSQWIFVNELQNVANPLTQGLGDVASGSTVTIAHTFTVVVPPNDTYRVYSGGWEADGIDGVMGELINPFMPCGPERETELDSKVFTLGVFAAGSRDDPIGEVNAFYGASHEFGVGNHVDRSSGAVSSDVWGPLDANPTDAYRLNYTVAPLSWPPASSTATP